MRIKFEKITEFAPAYDKRNPDPKKNYGIHGVTLTMVLKGPEGAVQFVIYTNWQLPHVQKESHERIMSVARLGTIRDGDLRCYFEPLPADLGYHSPKPMYEGQLAMGAEKFDFEHKETLQGETGSIEIPTRVKTGTFDPCRWLGGKPCYYDGSTLNAEPVFEVLLREGSAGVWRELRKYYDETFSEPKSE